MTAERPVERLAFGCVGEPGSRVFYLQADDDGVTSSYVLEKGQVAVLSVQVLRLLHDLGVDVAEVTLDVAPVAEPESVEFRVADVELDFDETTGLGRLLLVPTTEGTEPAVIRATAGQLAVAARMGAAAVASGRPLCPRCGLAMDPDGHPCPVGNGDLRHHRS